MRVIKTKMKTISELWKLIEKIELVQVRPSEMELIYNHCFEFKNPIIVEVGSAHGASSTILAEAAQELKGSLYCIDSFPEDYYGQEKFGEYGYQAFKKNVLDKYGKLVTFIRGTSSDVKDAQFGGAIDILFIDGDHSYQGVRNDLRILIPKLRSGGYVAFHDYNNNAAFPGVKKAADEFTKEWPTEEWPTESEWDLVIRRKP